MIGSRTCVVPFPTALFVTSIESQETMAEANGEMNASSCLQGYQ
jgi:hypothetical protein